MLKKLAKKFWRWLKSKPVPKANASLTDWYVWTISAPFWQVEEIYDEILSKVELYDKMIDKFFQKRLFGTPWPKLTDEFIEENKISIFKIPENVELSLKYIKKNCRGKFPKYLIDSKNQVLGIAVQPSLIISEYYNFSIDTKIALYDAAMYVPLKEIEYLSVTLPELNRMLAIIGLEKLYGNYWFDIGFRNIYGLGIWNDAEGCKEFCKKEKDQLLFAFRR